VKELIKTKAMIQSKSIQKGTIYFSCYNGLTAIFLIDFKKIKIFKGQKLIEEISSEGMKVSELSEKLEHYSA